MIGDAPKPVAPKIVYPTKMTSAATISVSSEIGPSRQPDFRRCGRTVNFALVAGTTYLTRHGESATVQNGASAR